MKITAITRYKHGELYAILNRLGWTQSELARRTGIQPGTIGYIINLAKRPSSKHANKIQSALGEAGVFFDPLSEWPEAFEGLGVGYKIEETRDIEPEALIGNREAMMIAAPQDDSREEVYVALESALSELSEREQSVLKHRFYENQTLDDIGKKCGVSRARVSQIEKKAIRTLRSPLRLQKLEEVIR